MKIVRSLDLGYGYVKFTTRNLTGNEPVVVVRQIPALALSGGATSFGVDSSGIKGPQTVGVNVKEALYHVGPDTPLLLPGRSGRDLSGEYSRTDRYMALMLGTLAYMGERAIDLLGLGLPVSRYKEERDRLATLFTGSVEVPMLTEPDRKQRVNIGRVVVIPQPMGGFIDTRTDAASQPNAEPWRGATLVIDPGFFTFDWIVVSENFTFVSSRSGAAHGGVSAILRGIANSLEEELGQKISDVYGIDQALKNNEPLWLYGKKIDLARFKPDIEQRCHEFVVDMVNRLGESGDLRRVVLCGGGARLFQDSVKSAFPGWEIHVSREPLYANVRGFQIFGENFAASIGAEQAA